MKFSNRTKIAGSFLLFLYLIMLIIPAMAAYRAIATTEESFSTTIEPNVVSDITNQKPNFVENYRAQNSSVNMYGYGNRTDTWINHGHYQGYSFNLNTANEQCAINNKQGYVRNELAKHSKVIYLNHTNSGNQVYISKSMESMVSGNVEFWFYNTEGTSGNHYSIAQLKTDGAEKFRMRLGYPDNNWIEVYDGVNYQDLTQVEYNT
jgi:hypothetical protein